MTLDDVLDSLPRGWEQLGREAWGLTQRYDPPLHIVDAKAKWGSLRIIISAADVLARPEIAREVRQALAALAERSERTCEECARPARLVEIGGWWSALCPADEAHRRRAYS
jgi:hypothetical protein